MSEIIDTPPPAPAQPITELEQMTQAYTQACEMNVSLLRSRDGFKALLAQTEEKLEASRQELAKVWTEPNPKIAELEEQVSILTKERDDYDCVTKTLIREKQELKEHAEAINALREGVDLENQRLMKRITELESNGKDTNQSALEYMQERDDARNILARKIEELARLQERVLELTNALADKGQVLEPVKRGPGRPPKNTQ